MHTHTHARKCSESFSQGKRIFHIDLRENIHGRFLKVTSVTNIKQFVAIPGNYITAFRDNLVSLLDENSDKFEEERAGGGEKVAPPSRALPPQQVGRSSGDGINDSREVLAGNKKFFFDVAQNSRGIYIQLTEVSLGKGVWQLNGLCCGMNGFSHDRTNGGNEKSDVCWWLAIATETKVTKVCNSHWYHVTLITLYTTPSNHVLKIHHLFSI